MYKAAIICSTVFPMQLHEDFYEFVLYNNNGFCEMLALLFLKWICQNAFCRTLKPTISTSSMHMYMPEHYFPGLLGLFKLHSSLYKKDFFLPLLPSLKICQETLRPLGTPRNCRRRDEVWNWITIS